MPQTHSTQTLLDYEELLYWYEQACDANDKAEMHSLSKQIIAYQKRWSLTCSSTSLQA